MQIVEPTMLGVVGNGVQVDVTMLAPAVQRGEDTNHKTWRCTCVAPTMLEELWKWIQHCCAKLGRSQNKRNVGSCWVKTLIGFKLCATPCNRECKRTQHVTSSNIESFGQQCCVRLHACFHDLRDVWPPVIRLKYTCLSLQPFLLVANNEKKFQRILNCRVTCKKKT